jgi:geranylgeranyl pyrophosphate synthase
MVSNRLNQSDFDSLRSRADEQLTNILDSSTAPVQLKESMHYCVLNGGKRIRATLVYLVSDALGVSELTLADLPAAAIELAHAYSLVHDDLPAMDDDDMRRGKPSCHVQFDEATAILTGDALQTLAFASITEADNLPIATRLAMLSELTRAIGGEGMVGGQVIDLSFENRAASEDELEQMHHMKTGALIRASIRLGCLLAHADENTNVMLDTFGKNLGLAFQVRDDILDATASSEALGKPSGSDVNSRKSTYVTVLGLPQARQRLAELHARTSDCLAHLGDNGRSLQQLADFVITRNH